MCAPGNLLGLALSPVLLAALGWRSLFFIFGAIGAPLLALWLAIVPARATRRESGVSAPCSTLDLLGSSATWAIIVSAPIKAACMPACALLSVRVTVDDCALHLQVVNIVNHWGYFIYLSWMPSYFHQVAPRPLVRSPLLCAGLDGSVTISRVPGAFKPACLLHFHKLHDKFAVKQPIWWRQQCNKLSISSRR